ncbi:MAG: serine--tRNA ligase [Turicibacter sp.]|nr:serine--tRNA ligase [Turicibacter sp.]
MLDIKMLRTDLEMVTKRLATRGDKFDRQTFESVLELDRERLNMLQELEQMRARQNAVSKEIPQLKKEGKDTANLMQEMKDVSDKIKILEPKARDLEQKIEHILMSTPNIPNENVPIGGTEEDNMEIRKNGTPPIFDFKAQSHWDLGEKLNILDQAAAAKITGSRFTLYRGLGARLERAVINFMLNTHIDRHGYEEVLTPYIVHRRSLYGTGQLPKFEEDLYKIENTEYFLNPTAEVPVTNIYREEILDDSKLPIYNTAYAPSFRQEAGSAGRDTRGIIRQHQFNKVELVKIVRPEDSYSELEKLTAEAETILKLLGLPYRVIRLCTGDLGFCSAMTYDIEVWLPSYERYVEISSCSNFEDFQARRAGIRYRDTGGKVQHVHTLNGSGLAVGRTVAAILENFQTAEGRVIVPEVLRPIMGTDII